MVRGLLVGNRRTVAGIGMSPVRQRVYRRRRHRRGTQLHRNITQTVTVRCADPERLVEFVKERDIYHATTDITGYMGLRLLADREHVGR